jgi:GNAT superfamily N-acetyltransferase
LFYPDETVEQELNEMRDHSTLFYAQCNHQPLQKLRKNVIVLLMKWEATLVETPRFRKVKAEDVDFLKEMTYEAAFSVVEDPPAFDEVKDSTYFKNCTEDWSKTDYGQIAVKSGNLLGAAWHRETSLINPVAAELFPEYKDTPELIMAVKKEVRGRRVGTLLLNAVMDHANANGLRQMILTVDDENTIARDLYRDRGFKVVSPIRTAVNPDRKATIMCAKLY